MFFALLGIVLQHTYVYMSGVASDAADATKNSSLVYVGLNPANGRDGETFLSNSGFPSHFGERSERQRSSFLPNPSPPRLFGNAKKKQQHPLLTPPPSHKEDFHVLCVVALHACVSYRMSPGSSFDPHTSVSHMSTAKKGEKKIVLYFRQTAVCVDS